MKNNSLLGLAMADYFTQKLWIMGLISDTEKYLIDSKNNASFLSN